MQKLHFVKTRVYIKKLSELSESEVAGAKARARTRTHTNARQAHTRTH